MGLVRWVEEGEAFELVGEKEVSAQVEKRWRRHVASR